MPSLDTVRLTRLVSALSDSKTALAAKGVTVPAGTLLDDLPTLIAQVPTGGSLPTAQPKDVNFYDYDGEIRYSYTLAQAAALTELPALPTHSGLTGVGWNYTLAQVKALTKPCNVGAIYKSSDNKTHIKLLLTDSARLKPYVVLHLNGTIKVNWGDGTEETVTKSSGLVTKENFYHEYSAPGEYEITFEVVSGEWCGPYGPSGLLYIDSSPSNNTTQFYQRCITAVTCGDTGASGTNGYPLLSAFQSANAQFVLIPYVNQWEDSSRTAFVTSKAIQCIHLPQGVTRLPAGAFSGCSNLRIATLPNGVTTLGNTCFKDCNGLLSLTIPSSVTSIGTSAFNGCTALAKLVLPNLQNIEASTFSGCSSMAVYDFSACQAVPTLANANAFSGIRSDCKIIVPDDLCTSWRGETNWVTYADNIISVTEANAA